MLIIITATYCVEPEPIYDPITKKLVERDFSDCVFEDGGRKLVIVYAGSNRVLPDGDSRHSKN